MNPSSGTFSAVFHDAEDAAEFIKASPHTLTVAPAESPFEPVTSPGSLKLPQLFASYDRVSQNQETEQKHQEKSHPAQEFVLSAQRSKVDHEAELQHKQYFWHAKSMKQSWSFMQEALLDSGVPYEGLSIIAHGAPPLSSIEVTKLQQESRMRKTLWQIWKEGQEETEAVSAKRVAVHDLGPD